ncbi:THO complex subunit 3 [Acipenser ruthenus]|uniref:THO complex subunit 3 n=3 Tax=Acipenseridae TaxID=7900 RepID=A0A444V3X8_ACIRT|nr:THO complex subunit 3 [Acipenser ruthenus]
MASQYYQEMQDSFRNNNKSREFAAHSAKVHSVAWSCDGRRLASGSFDKTASVFVLEKDRLVKENNYRGHGDSVDQLCWHPTSPDIFVTASGDKTIRIWDVRTTKCIATVNTKGENINICWSPDGQTIAVGNKDDVVTFIDAKSHRSRAEEQFKFEVNEISWNNDNDMFYLTNGNGCINILSYPELKPIQSINAHPSNCICIKFDPTGKYFATGSADALVSLWNVEELVCVRCFSRLDWPVRTLSFSHDGKMLASASEDHFIDIAEVETGEKLWEVQCESPTFTVAWHPKKPLLAYACDDKDGKYDSNREAGTVKLFGLPNDSYPELKPIQSINAHPSNCICIKFDPTGKYFATGSADALVSLWNVEELVCVRCFSRLDWPVRTLSFSHDGKMLASASEDHFIDIAEVETGEKLWEVQCESPTFTVAWHPKKPLLAYACDDKDGKYDSNREAGTVKLFGLPNDS